MLAIFLAYTVLLWIAGNCMLRVFFLMIAPGGALDRAFGWQSMLQRMYSSKNKWVQMAGMALGDCQTCTSFWFMPFWFVAYYGFSRLGLHYFITDEVRNVFGKAFVGIVWYLVWHSIGAILGMLALRIKATKTTNGL